jgi:signal transduction histidine kinase
MDLVWESPPGGHAVQFYENDDFLYRAVADFLAAGLAAGESAVVIATEAHRQGFAAQFAIRGIDADERARAGQLVLLDARETLARFMVGESPDWARFRAEVGALFQSLASRNAPVRAYGEMVDLLWRDGNTQAAIRLEELWNDLGREHPFSLLCAYVLGNFYKESHGGSFARICDVHSHVQPAETFLRTNEPGPLLRQVSVLQQRARSLEAEITHRKELEEALREALVERRRAEDGLRQSEDELRQQNEELARTVRFAETFIGILGHDLRNPLSGITTAATLLARRSDSEKVTKPANRILNSGRRMARMIDQLLDFTRIRLGHGIALERREMDLAEVCRVAVDELDSGGESRIDISTSGDVVGAWDGDRLTQLLSNLLSNALAHGERASRIAVAIDGTEEHAVVLTVANGGAVSPDLLPRMFEPFKTQEDRKHERSSGLGLGLYISQQIVLAHGGTIEVVSSPEEGTRFSVRLPRITYLVQPAFRTTTGE